VPINLNDSEGARDRAAHAGADVAALKNSKDTPASDATVAGNNADDKARAAKMNTPVGAACDYDQLRAADAVRLPEHSYSPDKLDDGTRLDSAGLVPNSEQGREFRSPRYDAAAHDSIAADHARRLQRSGGVDPTHDLGLPQV